ncbi:hypothetical protein FQR65_LT02051 [Abscondita terminalis]|nr:hypothetical protein FQR65_LT02051 [Abscondita terminalis]
MKTSIALALFSVLVTYSKAYSKTALDLENQILFQLIEILECVLHHHSQLPSEYVAILLKKLKEWLKTQGGCINVNITEINERHIIALVQCLIVQLDKFDEPDLNRILKHLQLFKCNKTDH